MFLLIHDLFGSVESAVLGQQGPVIQGRLLAVIGLAEVAEHGRNATLCTK